MADESVKNKFEDKINALANEAYFSNDAFEKKQKHQKLLDMLANYFFTPKYGSAYAKASGENKSKITDVLIGNEDKIGGCIANYKPQKDVSFIQYVCKSISISLNRKKIDNYNGIKNLPRKDIKNARIILKNMDAYNSVFQRKVSKESFSDFLEVAHSFTHLSDEEIYDAWDSRSIKVFSDIQKSDTGKEYSIIDNESVNSQVNKISMEDLRCEFEEFLLLLGRVWDKESPDKEKKCRSDALVNRRKIITAGLSDVMLNLEIFSLDKVFFDNDIFASIKESKEKLSQRMICKLIGMDTGKFANIKNKVFELIEPECKKENIDCFLRFK